MPYYEAYGTYNSLAEKEWSSVRIVQCLLYTSYVTCFKLLVGDKRTLNAVLVIYVSQCSLKPSNLVWNVLLYAHMIRNDLHGTMGSNYYNMIK